MFGRDFWQQSSQSLNTSLDNLVLRYRSTINSLPRMGWESIDSFKSWYWHVKELLTVSKCQFFCWESSRSQLIPIYCLPLARYKRVSSFESAKLNFLPKRKGQNQTESRTWTFDWSRSLSCPVLRSSAEIRSPSRAKLFRLTTCRAYTTQSSLTAIWPEFGILKSLKLKFFMLRLSTENDLNAEHHLNKK